MTNLNRSSKASEIEKMTAWRDPSEAPQEGWVLALLSKDLRGVSVWPVFYKDGKPFQIGMIFAFDKPDLKVLKIQDIPTEE